jgi:hypothetical protein
MAAQADHPNEHDEKQGEIGNERYDSVEFAGLCVKYRAGLSNHWHL